MVNVILRIIVTRKLSELEQATGNYFLYDNKKIEKTWSDMLI